MTDIKRRQLLKAGLGGLCATYTLGSSVILSLSGCAGGSSRPSRSGVVTPPPAPPMPHSPFTLGVASGEPATDGFVIWTRLALDPLGGGGMVNRLVPLSWRVSQQPDLSEPVLEGEVMTTPEWAHSAHIELSNLAAGQAYYYQFSVSGYDSPIGRGKTLPENPSSFRLAVTSCQHYQRGYYGAYRYMLADNPDLILHLGDYIYESRETNESQIVRQQPHSEPITLKEYRNHYALYRSDVDLQQAHQQHIWMTIWDDHEVDNDYANLSNQDGWSAEAFARRRAAAYQACYEHMPLRLNNEPGNGQMQLYRRTRIGDLLSLNLLDNRQYRDPQACLTLGKKPGRPLLPDCTERLEPGRSMLGLEQEDWLQQSLKQSDCQWNVLVQQQLFAPFRQQLDGQESWWSDDWNGYPEARDRLVRQLGDLKVRNPVVLTGDIHSFWANQIPSDSYDLTSAPVGSEFVTAGLTSPGPDHEWFSRMVSLYNPHVQFFESRDRGYLICDINRQRWQTRMISVDASQSVAPERVELARFEVRDGQPGPIRVTVPS